MNEQLMTEEKKLREVFLWEDEFGRQRIISEDGVVLFSSDVRVIKEEDAE